MVTGARFYPDPGSPEEIIPNVMLVLIAWECAQSTCKVLRDCILSIHEPTLGYVGGGRFLHSPVFWSCMSSPPASL